jgi:hypothetical protein
VILIEVKHMFYELINERVINKNKSNFGKVVCLLNLNNVKLVESYPIIHLGEKNE